MAQQTITFKLCFNYIGVSIFQMLNLDSNLNTCNDINKHQIFIDFGKKKWYHLLIKLTVTA